jgi:hypothetical protein
MVLIIKHSQFKYIFCELLLWSWIVVNMQVKELIAL